VISTGNPAASSNRPSSWTRSDRAPSISPIIVWPRFGMARTPLGQDLRRCCRSNLPAPGYGLGGPLASPNCQCRSAGLTHIRGRSGSSLQHWPQQRSPSNRRGLTPNRRSKLGDDGRRRELVVVAAEYPIEEEACRGYCLDHIRPIVENTTSAPTRANADPKIAPMAPAPRTATRLLGSANR